MSYDVFVSYSADDKPSADAVVAGLERHGIRCWIAPRDIGVGKEYGAEIIGGILQCRIMVLIFSHHSNNSNQVVREVERAIHSQKIIIPFRIENANPTGSMEYFLSLPHWLDAYTAPLSKHVDTLAATVSSILSGKPIESAPPPLPIMRIVPAAEKRRSLWTNPFILAGLAGFAGFLGLIILVGIVWEAVRFLSPPNARTPRPAASSSPAATPRPTTPSPLPTAAATPAASPRESEASAAVSLLVKQGVDFYNEGNYAAAVERHNQALALDPRNASAHFNRANALKAKKEVQAAIEDYTAAIALKPGFVNAYYNRGNAHVQQGDDVLALSDYGKAIELDPKNYLAYNNRGCIYKRQGAYDLAIADFSSALAVKPDYTKSHDNREAAIRAKTASLKPSGTPAPNPASAPASMVLFENGNIYATLDNPTRATMFAIKAPCRVTAITNYHWNSGRGADPGTIRLVQQGGKVFGPWKAAGIRGAGGVLNVSWIVRPDVVIGPGTYTVIDSSPESWSHNAASQGSGFCKVEGFEAR